MKKKTIKKDKRTLLHKHMDKFQDKDKLKDLTFSLGPNVKLETGPDSFFGVVDGKLVVYNCTFEADEDNMEYVINILNIKRKGIIMCNNTFNIKSPRLWTRVKRAIMYLFNHSEFKSKFQPAPNACINLIIDKEKTGKVDLAALKAYIWSGNNSI